MRIARIGAILMAVMTVILTVVPASDRPDTGIQHDIEHFGAFLVIGFLFGLGFEARAWVLIVAGITGTLMLECLQIPLPTRHARIEDFVVDSVGIVAGILVARLARSYLVLRHS